MLNKCVLNYSFLVLCWVLMCHLRCDDVMKALSQNWHWNGFSPVCVLSCAWRVPYWVKPLGQYLSEWKENGIKEGRKIKEWMYLTDFIWLLLNAARFSHKEMLLFTCWECVVFEIKFTHISKACFSSLLQNFKPW